MKEELDTVSLQEILDIYSELSSMLKSLEDKKKELEEKENNGK